MAAGKGSLSAAPKKNLKLGDLRGHGVFASRRLGVGAGAEVRSPRCGEVLAVLRVVVVGERLEPSTIRSQSRNGAPPQWQHRSPAMATACSPLLSPARESEGGAAAMWDVGTWSSNEAHPEGEGGVQCKEAIKVN